MPGNKLVLHKCLFSKGYSTGFMRQTGGPEGRRQYPLLQGSEVASQAEQYARHRERGHERVRLRAGKGKRAA